MASDHFHDGPLPSDGLLQLLDTHGQLGSTADFSERLSPNFHAVGHLLLTTEEQQRDND